VGNRLPQGDPGEIRDRVRNFFGNIGDVFIGVNNFLQGKFEGGVQRLGALRIQYHLRPSSVSTTSLPTWATRKHDEDFGQTFGRWGFGPGPYLVLPVLGSSNVRDGIGKGVDFYTDPLNETDPWEARWGLVTLRLIQTRADLLDASRILEEAALDRYVFQRDAYLQRRRSLVYDGRPPREKDPEDESDDKSDRKKTD
jgi:phospholipid-binding lipoprotein MlaA